MSYFLGVDLGTTYTAAALAQDGRAEPATLGTRSVAIPSVVYFDGDELVVGEPAARRSTTEPSRVASEFKRRLGDPVPILMDGRPVAADHLMARLLAWVVEQVTTTEGEAPEALAVTHPANWGRYKLDLFREAIQRVGLQVRHFVPEPVAAANFYAANRDLPPGTVVAVYDLGGGTFDAAIVMSEPSGFRILGQPDGIERLGGVDFDQAVLGHVVEAAGINLEGFSPEDAAMMASLAQLRLNCIEAKEALSAETSVSIPVMLPDLHTTVRLTRPELEEMIQPSLRETVETLRRAIAAAGVTVDDVSAVLLVGGSSRIPLVAQLVTAELGRPIAVDARPKDAIPLGAAITAWRAATAPPSGPPGSGAGPLPPPQIAVPHDLSQAPVPQPVALPPLPVPGGQTPLVADTSGPAGPAAPPGPAPAVPVPPPVAPGALPGPPAGRARRSRTLAAVVAGVAVLLLAGAAAWVALPSKDGDEVPEEAITRFTTACRQEFEEGGQTLAVREEICKCAVTEAQEQLTTEQFMANDRLLQETGDRITQDFLDIMKECRR